VAATSRPRAAVSPIRGPTAEGSKASVSVRGSAATDCDKATVPGVVWVPGGGAGLRMPVRWFNSLVIVVISADRRLISEPMPKLRLLETSPGMSCNRPELRSEIAKSPAKLNAAMIPNGVPSKSKLNAATSPINGATSDGGMGQAVVVVACCAVSGWCVFVSAAAVGAPTPDAAGASEFAPGSGWVSVAARARLASPGTTVVVVRSTTEASVRASTARNVRTAEAISDSAAARRTSAVWILGRWIVGLGANGVAATMLAAVKPASRYERAVRDTKNPFRESGIKRFETSTVNASLSERGYLFGDCQRVPFVFAYSTQASAQGELDHAPFRGGSFHYQLRSPCPTSRNQV
jgi:hypothetical protein